MRNAVCLIVIASWCGVCLTGCQTRVTVPSPMTSGLPSAIQSAFVKARAAVVDNPDSSIEWGYFGRLCMAHQFASEAISCFQMASKLDPHDGRWSYFQGILMEEIDLQGSAARYRETLAIDGNAAVVRFRLAQVLFRLGDLDQARSEFKIVANLKSDQPAPFLALARLAMTESDWPTAKANLIRASSLAPNSRAVYQELSRVAARETFWDEASRYQNLAQLATADEISLEDEWLNEVTDLELAGQRAAERADQLLAKGQFAAAASVLQEVVRNHPELPRARLNLAIALWQLGRTDESQREFHRLVAQFPDEPTGYLTWGRLLAAVGRFQEAKVRLKQAVDRKADTAEASAMLGTIAERQGHFEEAVEWYQRALRSAPEVASTYLALAAVHRQLGENSAADRVLKMASHLNHPSDQDSEKHQIERRLFADEIEPTSALLPENRLGISPNR